MNARRADAPGDEAAGGAAPGIRWDASNMDRSVANVRDGSSPQEELVPVFGVNQAWMSTR